jgi:hypothetical protein
MPRILLLDDATDAEALRAALAERDPEVVNVENRLPSRALLEQLAANPDAADTVAVIGIASLARMAAELDQARTQLEERKLVDRAKGLLMKHRGLSEDEAYVALRSLSMDRGIRLGEAARQVIDVASMLGPPAPN